MLDFLLVSVRPAKKGTVTEIYPKFIIKKNSNDLMIRGGDFYAIWIEEAGLWSTDEQDALQLIDQELDKYAEENKHKFDNIKVLHMWDADSGMIDKWHKYCQKQMRDSFHMLDEKIIFSNSETNKKDYASKRLPYPLKRGSITSYEKLISTLYSNDERKKIEWSIGSIVSGDSKKIQKFLVLYGAAGTGKSTILNIIQQLFEGYYSVFDAKALGSSNNSFALEAFKSNPLVAIQHDGDLSRIEDNTRLNSLVSHELMTVNEKFKSTYSNRFKAFLFMGTNKPVKITDSKSGLIRRLIDVHPTGDKIGAREYKTLVKNIEFELGGIAYHCMKVYEKDPGAYDDYIPTSMMSASNDFFNFISDIYFDLKKEDGVTLKRAWELYKEYCSEASVAYPQPQRIFKEELKSYFWNYDERYTTEDGLRVRSYYSGFKKELIDNVDKKKDKKNNEEYKIIFKKTDSIFDSYCSDCPAQYANSDEVPSKRWDRVTTTLSDIDTKEVHYVRLPENHIVIDFDIPDENGQKSFKKNLEAANRWPETYAELSKSGAGIHLHYIYSGDVSRLSRIYAEHIEIKVFSGKSSLRRKLTKCNNLPIATISSGLPLKGEKKMVNSDIVRNEKWLRSMIKRNLNKEFHAATKPSIDFIKKNLDDIYADGVKYDVTDMKPAVLAFAANSTNQSDYCIKLINKMKFKSDDPSEAVDSKDQRLVFYDIEVFPNLFLVNWKLKGENNPVIRMINPKPESIEALLNYRLVGFNCRRYDNHLLYARLMGYSEEQLFKLSQKIIEKKSGFFGEAYNLSYTDVYDFSSKKQSLKKWEIELGIHHQELGLPWDKPVPKEKWHLVAEYCDNDVIATEAVFDHCIADFTARKILADIAGMSVNDTTNSLTTRIIFGNNRKPQDQFNYRFMGTEEPPWDDDFTLFDKDGKPCFPGYIFDKGKSTYRDEEIGEGGYVYAEPGMYGNVALLDIASMHPSSIVAENLFGDEYTSRFNDILQARMAIKHKEFDKAKKMLNGKLAPYLEDETIAKDLAQALKIAINSVYGLTAATFENPFRDIRNIDNIVAKRGALFMVNLKHEVQKRGFIVSHIKTDSIKIPDATPEIINFVMDYGKQYGYSFEHEATYEKMCLVNDAVYVAKYKDGDWTATGTQFQVPYVFKTLFSKEPIKFEDMCETKSVSTALYLADSPILDELYAKQNSDLEEDVINNSENDISLEFDPNSYHFIGKVGQFCPIKEGKGGGVLLRQTNTGGFAAATGTKGYRWLESEIVKKLKKEKDIDKSYYRKLVDDAWRALVAYGDVEWFLSNDIYIGPGFKDGKPIYEKTEDFIKEEKVA